MTELKQFREVDAPVKYLPKERWTRLKIKSRNQYLVSTKGRIYSLYRDKLIKGRLNSGVRVLEIKIESKQFPDLPYVFSEKPRRPNKRGTISITVQQLIAYAFLKKPRGPHIVAHVNYDKENNAVDNIVYYKLEKMWNHSRASPMYHMSHRTGLKLTPDDVQVIRNLLQLKREDKLDITIRQIAKQFNIATMQVYRIQNGDLWAHAGKPIKQKEKPNRLPDSTVRKIRKLLAQGVTGRVIAQQLKIGEYIISRIKRNTYYRNIK
jgi:hypothetical protein